MTLGEKLVVVCATCTGVYLAALPTATLPLINNNGSSESHTKSIQEHVLQEVNKNKEFYKVHVDSDVGTHFIVPLKKSPTKAKV